MYQQILIIGHLGGDPTLRHTPAGEAVGNFTLAANRSWTGKDGQQQETTWYRVTTWGAQAEACHAYLTKGDRVLVIAEDIQIELWKAPDGAPKGIIEVTPRKIQFLTSRGGGVDDGDGQDSDSQADGAVPF